MDLNYQSAGQGTPIIFIHGFSLDSRMWQPQVELFSKTNQVITYDMRGFGKSPLPTGTYSHHEDLHNLATHLNLTKFHLVGLSFGGEIAIDYALIYPDTLLSLTLVSSSLGGYASTVDWRVYAKEQGLWQAKENWLNQDPRPKLIPPAIDRLGEIQVPTQILVGDMDLDYYHTIADLLADKIVNSRLEYITSSGHMVNLESPNEFNKILENFIKSK